MSNRFPSKLIYRFLGDAKRKGLSLFSWVSATPWRTSNIWQFHGVEVFKVQCITHIRLINVNIASVGVDFAYSIFGSIWLARSAPFLLDISSKHLCQQACRKQQLQKHLCPGQACNNHLGVSINGGTLKWMVYTGKSIYKWMIWG